MVVKHAWWQRNSESCGEAKTTEGRRNQVSRVEGVVVHAGIKENRLVLVRTVECQRACSGGALTLGKVH
jgi:hypothetical protein